MKVKAGTKTAAHPRPEVRRAVKDLFARSQAFAQLPPKTQAQIAHNTALVADYLAEASDTAGKSASKKPAKKAGPGLSSTAARKGSEVSTSLVQAVDFPDFVANLIAGVFHAIVDASIQQMEAYGKLVAEVAKSLNLFRDENVEENCGRDHLVEQFPTLFRISALKEKPLKTRKLASSRQQLLATMVLMGINRIVVTDGRISAGVRK